MPEKVHLFENLSKMNQLDESPDDTGSHPPVSHSIYCYIILLFREYN